MSKETKAALAALVAERAALVTELETVVNAAATETRDFTPEENFSRGELTVKIQGREDAIAVAEAARKTERKEKKAAQARMQYGTGYTLKGDGQMTKLSEHRVYESGNGRSFLQDAAIAGFGASAQLSVFSDTVRRTTLWQPRSTLRSLVADRSSTSSTR